MDKENEKPFIPITTVPSEKSFQLRSSVKQNVGSDRTILGSRALGENVNERIAARRRKSLEMMHNVPQKKSIKDVYDDEIVTDSRTHCTAIERFHLLLTKAKEQGMSVNNIYQFFSGETSATSILSIDKFITNLEKLGFVSFEAEEIQIIVKAICKNNDNMISLEEFKHYCCTEIQSIPWKAERLRLEESGDLEKIKSQISRKVNSERESTIYYGDQVFRSSRYFLRINASVEIRIYNCALSILTIQLFDQTNENELPYLYIRMIKTHPYIEEQIQAAFKNANNSYIDVKDDKAVTRLRWSAIGNFILDNIGFKCMPTIDDIASSPHKKISQFIPYVKFPNGEHFETLSSKPENIDSPPSITKASTMEEFRKTVNSFTKEHHSARVSRISAEELSSSVTSLLMGVGQFQNSGL